MMADQTGQSAGKLLMAGVFPGVLLGILYMIYIAVVCWMYPEMGPAIPREELDRIPVSKRITDSLKFALPPWPLFLRSWGRFSLASPPLRKRPGRLPRLLPDDYRLPKIQLEEF